MSKTDRFTDCPAFQPAGDQRPVESITGRGCIHRLDRKSGDQFPHPVFAEPDPASPQRDQNNLDTQGMQGIGSTLRVLIRADTDTG